MDLLGEFMLLSIGISVASGYVDLSRNKPTTQSLTRPCLVEACNDFYISSNAVDRDESTCTGSSVIGGSNAEVKRVWWRVDLGDIYSIYSINVLFKDVTGYEDRQRGRFAGFSLYLSEYGDRDNTSLCYKDGPQLPPLNFTTTCTGHGRYVIFYNERIEGVVYPDEYEIRSYTELCEVKVKECPGGWYGLGCKQQCSDHCVNNEVCNHVTGFCDNGCADEWHGMNCKEPCKDGNYGPSCIYNCSGHCLADVQCNKETGHCVTGCAPGYTGSLCNSACSIGHFGNQCKEICSQNCWNDEICNHIDGVCTNGCMDGYIGKRCNTSCQEGYFGQNCSGICSKKCISTCELTDGSCDCVPGWRGLNCSEDRVQRLQWQCRMRGSREKKSQRKCFLWK